MRAILAILLTTALASAQFFPFPGPGRAPSGGGGPANFEYISGAVAASGDASGPTLVTGTFTYPAGSTVLVFAGANGTISGVTCNSQALTYLNLEWVQSNYRLRAYVLYNTSAGTNITCTATWTASVPWRRIHAVAYTGLAASSAYLQGACGPAACPGGTGTPTTSRTTANVTTTVPNTIHIAYLMNWNGIGTYTAATNYNLDVQAGSDVTSALLSRIVTATGTYPSGNVATANSDSYAAFYMVFTPAES